MVSRLQPIHSYPPERPSTALGRVSEQLSSATQVFRVTLSSPHVAQDLLSWVRWA
jgi:hypothetical protein